MKEFTKIWLMSTGALTLLVGAAASIYAISKYQPSWGHGGETCWHDPHADLVLDFDFHTIEHGIPIRCGYLLPDTKSVLPRVLGEQIRATISDIECYPMEQKDCP